MKKLDPAIQQALDETRLPYSVEVGSRHRKIIVNGVFCGILPSGNNKAGQRTTKNTIAQIRRAARQQEGRRK